MPLKSDTGDFLVYRYIIKGQELTLLPEKAIWWAAQEALLLADVHFGKTGHFRKNGIAIPRQLEQTDLATLSDLCLTYSPKIIYILGDLVHSDLNLDWIWLKHWRELNCHPVIHLILGNHDIVKRRLFADLDVILHENELIVGPFVLRHKPKDEIASTKGYYLSGHVHPGYELRGKAKQRVVLPVFTFSEAQGILPAFGRFTGCCKVSQLEGTEIFAVLDKQVLLIERNQNDSK